MNTLPPTGIALFLVRLGILLGVVGAVAAVVTENPRLLLITSAGCFLYSLGSHHHTSRKAGRS